MWRPALQILPITTKKTKAIITKTNHKQTSFNFLIATKAVITAISKDYQQLIKVLLLFWAAEAREKQIFISSKYVFPYLG